MFKKLLLSVAVLLLVAVQATFIYDLQHGAAEHFMAVWQAFGVSVPEYTRFVYRTIPWWWLGPTLCVALLAFALHCGSRAVAAVAVLTSGALAGALFWSTYAPSLLVRLPLQASSSALV